MAIREIFNEFFDLIDKGRMAEAEKHRGVLDTYLALIGAGYTPEKAREIMDLYLDWGAVDGWKGLPEGLDRKEGIFEMLGNFGVIFEVPDLEVVWKSMFVKSH